MKTIQRAYKTELAPNAEAIAVLRQWAGAARFTFNWGLAARMSHYEVTGESLTHYAQDKLLTQLKRDGEHDWMNDVPRRALWYSLQAVDEAYKGFFRRVKAGDKPGFPRFKSRDRTTPAFTLHGSDIRVENDRIRFPKLGTMRLKECGYIPTDAARYMECTVTERGGRWFVSVSAEVVVAEHTPSGPFAVAHPGVRTHLVTLDATGTERRTANARPLEKELKRLARLQRVVARRQKGGTNRRKAVQRVNALHRHIADARKDALHKATHEVVGVHDPATLVVSKWDVRQMLTDEQASTPRRIRKRIRRGVADSAMFEMRRQLEYKAGWNGTQIIQLPADAPVSKRCSNCGEVNERFGYQIVFTCPACGFRADRETNATRNMMQLANSTGSTPGTGSGSPG